MKKKKEKRTSFGVQEEEIYSALGIPPPHWAPTVQSPRGAGIWDSDGEELSALVPELRLLKLSAVHWVIC